MRFSAAEIAAQPWKNGGGATRELALRQVGDKTIWRVSLAEIDRNGAFSHFPGLARIHCIISGAGLSLGNSDCQLAAEPFCPLHFDGGLKLEAVLQDGPCQAFNLIYDPQVIRPDMQVIGPGQYALPEGECLVFVLSGTAHISGQDMGQDAPLAAQEGWLGEGPGSLSVGAGSKAILLGLQPQI